MENLQLVLLFLGAIAIIAVLVHGFWSIRKQQPKGYKQSPMTDINRDRRDADGFDNDGIGEVRVVKAAAAESSPASDATTNSRKSDDTAAFAGASTNTFELSQTPAEKITKTRVEPSLSSNNTDIDEQTPVQESLFATDETVTAPAQTAATQQSNHPAQEQAQVSHQTAEAQQQVTTEAVAEPEPAEELGEPQDVLVLHVVAKEGEELHGAELLPCLLTLNFKFGDMNIFHRHEDNAGTGKVLFSMANMVKPGVFDPDNMEQFTTQGVVLFMTLPCHGDALMNFSIMLNSAHQIADDLGGEVLDGGRELWQESTKQNYIQRIRALV
ncbi:cell division protein ZipA [Shewanella fidelis]|uniref:Cell division protein ZipA n=1 Tax=Shewanella fidelis TaxID=173509 RepID=A0AAW8NM24_9GAMM|nr:cell division protein ZipA [Shewanella fidelis]MDR8523430.1 cell division protein ZipA [Shewanella fidelis]MDW4813336.1 cell division protein ZipA [Shewanella fidelis]MDW4817292.1 cell division protein ZipA [Shewanella fidelis]MDW4821351.1 cell division protein ZipA [Shewanella fidelis]MDW4824571.1 cell division protein ZipA [Shewanella fidelis]